MIIKLSKNNKGSGIAVVVYGVVLMLLLIFTAINIINAKVIENGYNSLRDAVLAASSGSVMHLLTTETGSTASQNKLIENDDGSLKYDVYLQLALGYIINRTGNTSSTAVQGSEVNNFIKLDHKKVVNSTMALLNDAVMRNKAGDEAVSINNYDKFKVLMFFIEPRYSESNYEKYFDIIVYTNRDCDSNGNLVYDGNRVDIAGAEVARGSMTAVYNNLQSRIDAWVNNPTLFDEDANNFTTFSINLNPNGGSLDELVRRMETVPYYLIVVKDFSLPTIFGDTHSENNVFRMMFESLSGDGKLKTPMCALNAGKTERILKEN